MKELPISTQWTLDASGETGRTAISSVFMVLCPKTSQKGTSFLLKNGLVITNEHVIRNCRPREVHARTPFGETLRFSQVLVDVERDLAILFPIRKLKGGLVLGSDQNLKVGFGVSTWGFPLGYNGPAPLLSAGYLAGFLDYIIEDKIVKRLVVNGAFNPGNSGGPLFEHNDNKVIGVVVSKHAPISDFHKSALKVLAENRTGVTFTGKDDKGNPVSFAESQIVADLLYYFRNLTQVMIGEAISVSELERFLEENGVPIP